MLLDHYKRNYRYKSDQSGNNSGIKWGIIIAIIISAALLYFFYF